MAAPDSGQQQDEISSAFRTEFTQALAAACSEMKLPFELKPEQIETLEHLFNGHDVISLLPTGFGKSVIYQTTPFLLKHTVQFTGTSPITIVITPLNAIMKEQIMKLGAMGISACGLDFTSESVTTWTSVPANVTERAEPSGEGADAVTNYNSDDDESPSEDPRKIVLTNGSMDDLKEGKFHIVYAHPEALVSSKEGQDLLRSQVYQQNVCCVAIDEAHLVQQWGATFREDFLQLSDIIALFDSVPHLVLSATASPKSVSLLQEKLQLLNCVKVTMSPDRPNITYWKYERDTDNRKGLRPLLSSLSTELIEKGDNFPLTVLYTDLDSIAKAYRHFKHRVPDEYGYKGSVCPENRRYAQYHAHYDEKMKLQIIEDLGKDNPIVQIVLTTVALGMGLDAKGIRRVIHFKAPRSIEDYMQETGRAGRDEQPAEAILYYNGNDLRSNREGLTESMRKYCVSTDVCLREMLLKHFEAKVEKRLPGSKCCIICAEPPTKPKKPTKKRRSGRLSKAPLTS